MIGSKERPLSTSVSILVTVYNREPYLAACLDSILASSYGDFEVVVVDDASSDGSVAIAEDYAKRDSRIRLFRNEQNLGDYRNRARAISLSRALLLKFVDADDLIYSHSLTIMVEAMERFPEAALALSHSAPEWERPYPVLLSREEAYRKQFHGRGCLSCGPTGAIFRREAFDAVGGFRDWGVLSDIDLWQRIAGQWPVVLLPPALVWWRRHEGQEFSRRDAEQIYLERGFQLTMETLAAEECPLSEEEKHSARARAKQHHARRLLALASKGRQPREAWRLFRSSGLEFGELMKGLRGYGL